MSGFIGTRFFLCTSLVFLAMLACGSAMAQVVSTKFKSAVSSYQIRACLRPVPVTKASHL